MTPSPVAARPTGPGVTFSISEEENLITWASEGGDSYAMAFHSPSGCAQVWADLQVVLSSDFDDPTNIYGEPLSLPAADAQLTRTPRGLCGVRTGYAHQPPALGTHRRRRAACPQGPTYCTYWLRVPATGARAYRAYCVPWHPG